jgi:hypothetical protein
VKASALGPGGDPNSLQGRRVESCSAAVQDHVAAVDDLPRSLSTSRGVKSRRSWTLKQRSDQPQDWTALPLVSARFALAPMSTVWIVPFWMF